MIGKGQEFDMIKFYGQYNSRKIKCSVLVCIINE